MKTKNSFIILGIVFVLAIIALILFGVFGSLSILPIETKSVDWQGIPVIISASGFGTNINDRYLPFCGSNDADNTARNNYNVNGVLSLSSSISATHRAPCGPNIIYAEFEVPAGKLTGDCTLRASETYDERSVATCKIGDFSAVAVHHVDCFRGQSALNDAFWQSNCVISNVNKDFTLTFEEPTKIKVEITTSVGGTGSASGTISLNFEEKDPCEGIICLNYCDNSVKKYNSRCVSGQCIYTSKTCEFGCTDGECNIISPPTPPQTFIEKILNSITNWFKWLFGG